MNDPRAAIEMDPAHVGVELAVFAALTDLAVAVGPRRASRVAVAYGVALLHDMTAPAWVLDDPEEDTE